MALSMWHGCEAGMKKCVMMRGKIARSWENDFGTMAWPLFGGNIFLEWDKIFPVFDDTSYQRLCRFLRQSVLLVANFLSFMYVTIKEMVDHYG